MWVSRVILKNWRNFLSVDIGLHERTYVLGPNASGKSNLLDVFRFLRDISKPEGGGLQKAIASRGGLTKLRCLHARRDPVIRLEIELQEASGADVRWRYILAVRSEGKGQQRPVVAAEEVFRGSEALLRRPNKDDDNDPVRLTQTNLEQIQSNASFRLLADAFSSTTYLHLVPQLLKFGDRVAGHVLEDDPFGQGFLERIARTPAKTRESRLSRIQGALALAVPQFEEIRFEQDKVTGRPHLVARYAHHRPQGAWQREEHFSDGTLRLLGLLWSILDGDSLLLLEEPELSLNDGIVRQIPLILDKIVKDRKRRRQIITSTHSDALLSNPGIDANGVIVLEPAGEGSRVRQIDPSERAALEAGLSVAEVVLPKIRPTRLEQLTLL